MGTGSSSSGLFAMPAENRRASQRYPVWLPIKVRIDGEHGRVVPAMLCDVSDGGALVWADGLDARANTVTLLLPPEGRAGLDCDVVGVDQLFAATVVHLKFACAEQVEQAAMGGVIDELRANFERHQKYLAFRADDDPGLARTITQYPG